MQWIEAAKPPEKTRRLSVTRTIVFSSSEKVEITDYELSPEDGAFRLPSIETFVVLFFILGPETVPDDLEGLKTSMVLSVHLVTPSRTRGCEGMMR